MDCDTYHKLVRSAPRAASRFAVFVPMVWSRFSSVGRARKVVICLPKAVSMAGERPSSAKAFRLSVRAASSSVPSVARSASGKLPLRWGSWSFYEGKGMKVELWPAGDTIGITQVAGGTCDGRKVAPETSPGSPASSPYLVEHPSGATDGCLGSADGRLGATDRRWWAFQPALGATPPPACPRLRRCAWRPGRLRGAEGRILMQRAYFPTKLCGVIPRSSAFTLSLTFSPSIKAPMLTAEMASPVRVRALRAL